MTGRRLIWIGVLAAAVLAGGADAASASASASTPLYVSTTGKDAANPCTSASSPCKTIVHAVLESQSVAGTSTINVAAGTYQEEVPLSSPADEGIAIVGAGSGPGGT